MYLGVSRLAQDCFNFSALLFAPPARFRVFITCVCVRKSILCVVLQEHENAEKTYDLTHIHNNMPGLLQMCKNQFVLANGVDLKNEDLAEIPRRLFQCKQFGIAWFCFHLPASDARSETYPEGDPQTDQVKFENKANMHEVIFLLTAWMLDLDIIVSGDIDSFMYRPWPMSIFHLWFFRKFKPDFIDLQKYGSVNLGRIRVSSKCHSSQI